MKVSNLMMKVIVWRCLSIALTLLVMYVVTGDVSSATGITIILHAVLTLAHYWFERYWGQHYEKIKETS